MEQIVNAIKYIIRRLIEKITILNEKFQLLLATINDKLKNLLHFY